MKWSVVLVFLFMITSLINVTLINHQVYADDFFFSPANPANPSSLLNPANPANPASPLNPLNQMDSGGTIASKEFFIVLIIGLIIIVGSAVLNKIISDF